MKNNETMEIRSRVDPYLTHYRRPYHPWFPQHKMTELVFFAPFHDISYFINNILKSGRTGP